MSKHVIVLDIPGLSSEFVKNENLMPNAAKLIKTGTLSEIEPVFPAVTSTVQSSMLTGKYPDEHGIICNGLYDRNNYKVSFWEQADKLVLAPRIWDIIKEKNPKIKTAVLFFQNTMFSNSDIVITPAPVHAEDGKMIEWCYSRPTGLYETIAKEIGEFSLMSYWGPFASVKSSEWIAKSASFILEKHKPDLLFAYIPHLDYSFQRFGTKSSQVLNDIQKADELIGAMLKKIDGLNMQNDTTFIILSEYAFTDVNQAIPINLMLREQGFLKIKDIKGIEFIDFENSTAFAMVDHQIAHIYIKNGFTQNVYSFLKNIKGINLILDEKGKKDMRISSERSGELIAVSNADKWFSYYWWNDLSKAPGFARTVDIHRKPGYDPLELFFDPVNKSISLNPELIKASHGCPIRSGGKNSMLLTSPVSAAIKDINNSTDIFQLLLKIIAY